MKACLLVGVALLFVPSIAPMRVDEPAKVDSGGLNCPLFAIEDYPPDALYYCDYMNASCEWQDASFWFGPNTTSVPYVHCPGDCKPEWGKDAHSASHSAFAGLSEKVPLAYMHQPPKAGGPATREVPATAVGVGINKARNAHFVTFQIDGKDFFAKVIEFRFNRPIAELRKGATDADIDGKWESRFVAFEVESNPKNSGHDFQPIAEITPLNAYALKGRIIVAPRQSAPVLIVLAGPGNVKKKAH